MRQIITAIILLASVFFMSCQSENQQNTTLTEVESINKVKKESETKAINSQPKQSDTIRIDPDSIMIISSMFLYEGIAEKSKYYLEEPDIDQVYRSNPALATRYFAEILKTYELTYPQKLNIAYYLYLSEEPQYFQELKDKPDLTESENRVLQWYISNYKMEI